MALRTQLYSESEVMEIGLFYGSSTCYTEMAAEKIAVALSPHIVRLHNIREVPLAMAERFDLLIFGISTWDFGELQEDWASHWQDVASLDLRGRVIALFGLGDQAGYGEWFLDAMGMLHELIAPKGANLIGFWPVTADYQFTASKALTSDGQFFVGLALDEEGQYSESERRIRDWAEQLKEDLQALT